MGNLIAPVRVKPTNVSQNDMDERIHHLQSMIYVTHSNRIITYSQKNPCASNEVNTSSCQTRPATILEHKPSELVVKEASTARSPLTII